METKRNFRILKTKMQQDKDKKDAGVFYRDYSVRVAGKKTVGIERKRGRKEKKEWGNGDISVVCKSKIEKTKLVRLGCEHA
jgi:hypothetical protein